MLSPEQAKSRLEEFLLPLDDQRQHEATRFLDTVDQLPGKLQPIVQNLLRDPRQEGDRDFAMEAVVQLEALSVTQRVKIFRLIFGAMAEDIELAWQWQRCLPFSGEHSHSPFRSPGNPDANLISRRDWLLRMCFLAAQFKENVLSASWLATWGAHIQFGYREQQREIGVLCAAVISAGKKQDADLVFETLRQILNGEHEIGAIGRYLFLALAAADREEGWGLLEKTLLAAQRQEGLRQSILRVMGLANPEAFRRILQLIVDQKLVRFSSVVQFLDVWFGLEWSSMAASELDKSARLVLSFLADEQARKKAFAGQDAKAISLALWAEAYWDQQGAAEMAGQLLDSKDVAVRYVAVLHGRRSHIARVPGRPLKAVRDPDIRVVSAQLFGAGSSSPYRGGTEDPEVFECLASLVRQMEDKVHLKPLVWPWTEGTLKREHIVRVLAESTACSGNRLMDFADLLDSWQRKKLVKRLGRADEWDAQTRSWLLDFVGDRSVDVSSAAVELLLKRGVHPEERQQLEGYLTRSTVGLRKGVLQLLLSMGDQLVLESAERLLSGAKKQRMGGLELLRQMCEAERVPGKCLALAERWSEGRKVLKEEQVQLDGIQGAFQEPGGSEAGAGLYVSSERTARVNPHRRNVVVYTPAVSKLLLSLDDVVHQHRDQEVNGPYGTRELLGQLTWGLGRPHRDSTAKDAQENYPCSKSGWNGTNP